MACGPPLRRYQDWISGAEQSGQVVRVDEVVLRTAVRQLARWRHRSPTAGRLHMAVNVSGRTLVEPGLDETVLRTLREEGLPPHRLLLEVTEGVLLEQEAAVATLQRLRAAGVRIALDDFGTGWSSLTYLRRFPVDVLKLDRTFTSGLGQGGAADAVPAAVLQLASALELDVVAEGVEEPAQAEALRALGCRLAQGWLFGRAEPADCLEPTVVRAPLALAPAVGR